MKYIYEDSDGFTCFDRYFEYLNSIKSSLPAHVYEFASDGDRYSLDSSKSLHDAWVNSLLIKEPSTGDRSEFRKNDILLELFGPYHDRVHSIQYIDVLSFTIENASSEGGYGDLLIHEISLVEENIRHEIVFSSKANIVIKCKDIIHSELIIN